MESSKFEIEIDGERLTDVGFVQAVNPPVGMDRYASCDLSIPFDVYLRLRERIIHRNKEHFEIKLTFPKMR
jgi:hypothetical protein